MLSCHHPRQGEPALCLYAFLDRYHLLAGGTGVDWTAALLWGVSGVPGHKKEQGDQDLEIKKSKCLLVILQSLWQTLFWV